MPPPAINKRLLHNPIRTGYPLSAVLDEGWHEDFLDALEQLQQELEQEATKLTLRWKVVRRQNAKAA